MEPTPIPKIWADLTAAAPDAPAITCGDRTITRLQLEQRSNRLGRAFLEAGLASGDVVLIALPNGIEFYETCMAVWKAGGTVAPISFRLPKNERDAIAALAAPALIVGIDDTGLDVPVWPAGRQPDPSLSDEPLPLAPPVPWKIQTSGGSTGRPKLIVSGSTTTQNVDLWASVFGHPRDGVQVVAGPLYHTASYSQSFFGLFVGQHLIVLPRFDEVAALEAITDHEAQFVKLVPTMMSRMVKAYDENPSRYSFASLERVWHTGAPCPPWLKRRWIELVGGSVLWEVYGGAEQQAFTLISGDEWLEHPGSVGQVKFGEMKVVDEAGNELGRGEVGELYLRTPPGAPPTYRYIGAEARTLPGGWESLGELGLIDEDGWVFLTDRRTDMFLVGGMNIYPAEIEGALIEHPSVVTCAVVGLPSEDLGATVHAVLQTSEPVSEAALTEHLRTRLEPHKLPRSYHFVADDLRDDAGKVRRLAVRDAEIDRLGLSRQAPQPA
jgi:bile acid-coenzyme A ligase